MADRRQQTRKKGDDPPPVDAPGTAEPDSSSEQLLIFRLAGEPFGVTLSTVAEIIRLPNLVHMPLVPASLIGLANLRGVVLPVVGLAVAVETLALTGPKVKLTLVVAKFVAVPMEAIEVPPSLAPIVALATVSGAVKVA